MSDGFTDSVLGPHPDSTAGVTDFARVYRESAKRMETAGNIASGQGEYGLANGCWSLAARLREKARAEKEKQ